MKTKQGKITLIYGYMYQIYSDVKIPFAGKSSLLYETWPLLGITRTCLEIFSIIILKVVTK